MAKWVIVGMVVINLILGVGLTYTLHEKRSLEAERQQMQEKLVRQTAWADDQVQRYKLWVPDQVWKDADAVYFFQLTGSSEQERQDAWKRAYRTVYDGWHKEGFTVVNGSTFTYNEERQYTYFVVGFRIPPERKGELPQFLQPDLPTTEGGRISGCGWLKGAK